MRSSLVGALLRTRCLTVILWAVPASGWAAPDGPPVKVTWAAVMTAAERHPGIAAGNFEVDAARGGVSAAGAVPNPSLEGTLGQGSPRGGGTSRVEWGLSMTIPLGWISQRGSRVEAAEAGVDLAMAEAKALRRDVILRLRTLFWSLAYEQSRVASLEALEAQTAVLVQIVKRRVDEGEARPVEATRVEIELEKVRSELDVGRAGLEARRGELLLWLGLPAATTLVAVADLETPPVAMGREPALAGARASHPTIARSRARTRSLEAEVGTEKMARVPSFSVTGFTAYELDRRAFGAGVAVDLPLWNWNSGRIAQAEGRLAAGRKQAEAAWLEVESAVIDAQAACEASVATATRFKTSVVPRSEAAASIMERTYQLGEASLLEVIDARRTLLDARRAYLGALSQAQIDCSRLGALVGEDAK